MKLFILQTFYTRLWVCYGDLDSKKNKVCRPNVRPENVDHEQVRDVERVAEDEALLTDLKWSLISAKCNCFILYSPTFGTLSAVGWTIKDSWRGDPGVNGSGGAINGGGASQTELGKMIRTRRKTTKTFRWLKAIFRFESPNSGIKDFFLIC